jgi:hypothetical protein
MEVRRNKTKKKRGWDRREVERDFESASESLSPLARSHFAGLARFPPLRVCAGRPRRK